MVEERISRVDVSLGQALLRECRLKVIDRDLLAALEHAALVAGDIDQNSTREDGRDVFDAELPAAAAIADLPLPQAVVVTLLVRVAGFAMLGAHVTERIELRSVLGNVPGDVVLVPEQLVLASGAIGRPARHEQRVLATERGEAEQRHRLLVDEGHVVDRAGPDQPARLQDLGRCEPVECAELIVRAPLGRPPLLASVILRTHPARRTDQEQRSECQPRQNSTSMHRFPPSVRTLLRGLNSGADEFTPGAGYYMPKVSPGHN